MFGKGTHIKIEGSLVEDVASNTIDTVQIQFGDCQKWKS